MALSPFLAAIPCDPNLGPQWDRLGLLGIAMGLVAKLNNNPIAIPNSPKQSHCDPNMGLFGTIPNSPKAVPGDGNAIAMGLFTS